MSGDVLAQYSKKCLLKARQTFTCVDDSLKKLAIEDKTKPLGFQKVGPKNEQPRVTWLGHLIVSTCVTTFKKTSR
jgi:hypothetical protein